LRNILTVRVIELLRVIEDDFDAAVCIALDHDIEATGS
jgi:hypothetical protein